MTDFFAQSPLAQAWGLVFVIFSFAVLMVVLTALISRFAGEALNGISVSIMGPLGALFGLTAAFLGSTVAQNHADAVVAVNQEARSLSEAWFIAQALPPPLRVQIQGDIRDYVTAVVKNEWPQMTSIQSADNSVSGQTRMHLLDAVRTVVEADAVSPSPILVTTGDTLRNAFEARSSRIDIAIRRVNRVQFYSTLALGLILISLIAIVHHARRASQLMAVGLVSLAVATALGTIVMQDNPFVGILGATATDFAHTASYGTNFSADPKE